MIFQPSNITPSTFAGQGGGTVAAASPVVISWQVNGNSALLAYAIRLCRYSNGTYTEIANTGVITLATPIQPNDSKGNANFATYQPANTTWASWGVADGNDYVIYINQYYDMSSEPVVQYSPSFFRARTAPTLSLDASPSPIPSVKYTFTATYAQAQGDGIDSVEWQFASVVSGNRTIIDDTGKVNTSTLAYTCDGLISGNYYAINCIVTTTSGITIETGYRQFAAVYVRPSSASSLTLACNGNYNTLSWTTPSPTTNIPGTASGTYHFAASTLQLENGATATWSSKDGSAMSLAAPYSILYKSSFPYGDFSYTNTVASLSPNLAANKMSYCESKHLLCILMGTSAYMYSLATGTLVLVEQILHDGGTSFGGQLNAVAFSPDGSKLVIGGAFFEGACWYTVNASGNTTYQGTVIPNISSNTMIWDIAWLSDSFFGICGAFDDTVLGACSVGICEATNTSCTLSEVLQSYAPGIVAYSLCAYNGTLLVGGDFGATSGARQFINSPSGFRIVDIKQGTTPLGVVRTISVSPDGNIVLIGGNSFAKIFNASAQFTYIADLNAGGSAFAATTSIRASAWSQDSSALYIGTDENGSSHHCYIYKISQTSGVSASYVASTTYTAAVCSIFIADEWQYVLVGIRKISAAVNILKATHTAKNVLTTTAFTVSLGSDAIAVKQNSTTLLSTPIPLSAPAIGLTLSVLMNGREIAINYPDTFVSANSGSPSWTLPTMTSIALSNAQKASYLYVASTIVSSTDLVASAEYLYTYAPDWLSPSVFMLTNFAQATLQAGRQQSDTYPVDIYRLDVTASTYTKICSAPANTTTMRDFGTRSQRTYQYFAFVLGSNKMSAALASTQFCTSHTAYELIEATQDGNDANIYHAVRAWRFGNNMASMSMSNNNSPNMAQNFTRYRRKQPSSLMAKSGTLSALLSNVSNGAYADTAEQIETLFEASLSQNQFFLRDTKGSLLMIAISAPITQSVNSAVQGQPTTISVAWEETDDSDGVSVIQLPTDAGYNAVMAN